MKNIIITNNAELSRYEYVEDSLTAYLKYKMLKEKLVSLPSVQVPSQLEGKGIGTQLVAFALADLEQKGFKIIPICPFVVAYIQRHPEWDRIVAKE